MDPFPPIPADAEVHADENVCEPRERAWAIMAIVIAFLLALGVTFLSLHTSTASDLVIAAEKQPTDLIVGPGLGTGNGSGVGPGEGVGAGQDGDGPGAGDAGEGRMAQGPEAPAPPPGQPDGGGPPAETAEAAAPAPAPEPSAPQFGFTTPEVPTDIRPATGVPEGSPSSGSSGVAGGGGAGVEFMGVRAEGKTVVYLVDRSISMRDLFAPVMQELERSLNGLQGDSRFAVAFFGGTLQENMRDRDWRLMPPGSTVRAVQREVARAVVWARLQAPEGDTNTFTNPSAAIVQLMALRPDAVFMLTDGEFDDEPRVMATVTRWVQVIKRPIHTVLACSAVPKNATEAAVHEKAKRLLSDIARMTGGKFSEKSVQ